MFLLICMLSGLLVGSIAGLLPGVGITLSLIAASFIIQSLDLIQILVFYIAALSASQYTGSITAITFGVPGENNSLPAVKEGNALFMQGKGSQAIGLTALGSFLGSLLAVAIILVLFPVATEILKMWNNNIQVLVFVVAILISIQFSDNRLWISCMYALVGLVIGSIGIRYTVDYEILTFNQSWLYNGIPIVPFIVGVYVIPELVKNLTPNTIVNSSAGYKICYRETLQLTITHIYAILRGAIVGFFVGLVPALSGRLPSTLSYIIEKSIEENKQRYSRGNYASLAAAETGNNSASLSVILPLLFLGIPLTTSEFILLDFLQSTDSGMNFDLIMSSIDVLIFYYILANVLALAIAWPLANFCLRIYSIPVPVLYALIASLVILPVIYMGYSYNMTLFYCAVLTVSSVLGLALRKTDTMPIVIAFFVSSMFLDSLYRFYQINIY